MPANYLASVAIIAAVIMPRSAVFGDALALVRDHRIIPLLVGSASCEMITQNPRRNPGQQASASQLCKLDLLCVVVRSSARQCPYLCRNICDKSKGTLHETWLRIKLLPSRIPHEG
jgi:hypothetical protein